MHPLLEVHHSDLPAMHYAQTVGTLFAAFDRQDSGNVSYGVQLGNERFFLKTAGDPDDTRPLLKHEQRAALLRNATRLQQSVGHPALLRTHNVIETATGPLLVYPWFDGELLGVRRAERGDPRSPFQRFRALPPETILACLDTIYELHERIAGAGWVAHDFYDGCLLYHFASGRLAVIDLDTYNQGAFQNSMGRMFGSSRFMAPEEFERGARIDQRTTVFTLGRTALELLSDGTRAPGAFRGSAALLDVALAACAPSRADRFASVAEFAAAWRAARGA
jgi:serine/threonine-protein kinase